MKPLPSDGLRAAVRRAERRAERRAVVDALAATRDDVTAAARRLGIDPRYLQGLMARYHIVARSSGRPSAIPPGGLKQARQEARDRIRAWAVPAAIERTGSISAAARALGISRACAQMIVRGLDDATSAVARTAHQRRLAERERLLSDPAPSVTEAPPRSRGWLTLAERQARAREAEINRGRIRAIAAAEQEAAARVHIRELAQRRASR